MFYFLKEFQRGVRHSSARVNCLHQSTDVRFLYSLITPKYYRAIDFVILPNSSISIQTFRTTLLIRKIYVRKLIQQMTVYFPR